MIPEVVLIMKHALFILSMVMFALTLGAVYMPGLFGLSPLAPLVLLMEMSGCLIAACVCLVGFAILEELQKRRQLDSAEPSSPPPPQE